MNNVKSSIPNISAAPTPAQAAAPVKRMDTRADSIQEIISHRPGFIERWTLPIFFAFIIVFFIAAWFIHYPDVIYAPGILTGIDAPKEIIPRSSGRITKLYVHNDEKVQRGQIIGLIESTADHQEVLSLAALLDSSGAYFESKEFDSWVTLLKRPYHHLGELQTAYQQFIHVQQQSEDYLVNGYFMHRLTLYKQDLDGIRNMYKSLRAQELLATEEVRLAEESYKMNSQLFEQKVIAREELRTQQSLLFSKQAALLQLQTGMVANENQQREKQQTIDQQEHDIAQQKIIFEQATQTLKSSVENWISKYILTAATTGKIVFTKPVQENQFIQENNILGYINPENTHYYMEIKLAQENYGKVDTGLHVQVRFDAYPYQEFGTVAGKVNYVSQVGTDSGFIAHATLDKDLHTNMTRTTIPYKSGLKAQTLIITNETRLLERFYYNFRKMFSSSQY